MKITAIILTASILLGAITGSFFFILPAGICLGVLVIMVVVKGLQSGEAAQHAKDVEKAKKMGATDLEAEMFASQEATRRNVQIYGH